MSRYQYPRVYRVGGIGMLPFYLCLILLGFFAFIYIWASYYPRPATGRGEFLILTTVIAGYALAFLVAARRFRVTLYRDAIVMRRYLREQHMERADIASVYFRYRRIGLTRAITSLNLVSQKPGAPELSLPLYFFYRDEQFDDWIAPFPVGPDKG